MRLDELRQLVKFELLIEGADIGALASRGLKSRAVIVGGDGGEGSVEWIIVVSSTEKVDRHGNQFPKILAGVEGERTTEDTWAIRTLFSEDPVSAIVVLAASLGRWKRVVPDRDVSPAAKAVIKRYYDANKDDYQKIDQDPYLEGDRRQYLQAIYLGPLPGFNLRAALQKGDALVNDTVIHDDPDERLNTPERVRSVLVKQMINGFGDAYQDPDRTKKPLPDFDKLFEKALTSKSAVDRSALMYKIEDGLRRRGSRHYKFTLAWATAHRDELDVFFQSIKNWANHIAPQLASAS